MHTFHEYEVGMTKYAELYAMSMNLKGIKLKLLYNIF